MRRFHLEHGLTSMYRNKIHDHKSQPPFSIILGFGEKFRDYIYADKVNLTAVCSPAANLTRSRNKDTNSRTSYLLSLFHVVKNNQEKTIKTLKKVKTLKGNLGN